MFALLQFSSTGRGRRIARGIAPGLILAVVTLCVFGALAMHPSDVLVGRHRGGHNDLTSYFLATFDWPATSGDRFGERASWNPYRAAGLPHTGNPQAALHYIGNLPAALSNHPARLGWVMVFHHWLAGLGTYLLCRRYGRRRLGALVAGVVMAAAPYLLVHTAEGHYTLICAAAWFPWAFLAYERLRSGARGGLVVTAAVLALCFTAGHAQSVYYLVLVLSVWRLADAAILLRQGRRADAGQAMLQWTLIGLLTAQLAAIDLVPQWTFARASSRAAGLSAAGAGAISIGWSNFLQVFVPRALGDATSYRGPGVYFHETLCYFGVIPLLLAACGIAATHRQQPSRRWFVTSLAALLFAAGTGGVLFFLLFHALPGVALFRAPARALLFVSLGIAIFAAAGADRLVAYVALAARRICRSRRRAARVAAIVAILMVAGELCWFGATQLATVPPHAIRSNSEIATWLAEHAGDSRVVAPQALLTDREAQSAGIYKVQAYEPVTPAALAGALVGTADPQASAQQLNNLMSGFGRLVLVADRDVLDLLGARFVVLPASQKPPGDGWKLRKTGIVAAPLHLRGESPKQGRYAIYENENVLPRAFVVGKVIHSPTAKESLAALRDFDPRREVVLAKSTQYDDVQPGPSPNMQAASIVDYSPDRVVIEAEISQPGFLVLSDTWFPGWKAAVDGQPADILPANVAFRAVPMPAGRHRVEMTYEPPGLAGGRMLSLLALAGLLMFGALELRRDRRFAATPAKSHSSIAEPPCVLNSSN